MATTLRLRNPHSVLAALESRPSDVIRVSVSEKVHAAGDTWQKVARLARENGIPVQPAKAGALLPQGTPRDGGREGLAEAEIEERPGISAEELFQGAKERADGK